jgi:hypothetical protein
MPARLVLEGATNTTRRPHGGAAPSAIPEEDLMMQQDGQLDRSHDDDDPTADHTDHVEPRWKPKPFQLDLGYYVLLVGGTTPFAQITVENNTDGVAIETWVVAQGQLIPLTSASSLTLKVLSSADDFKGYALSGTTITEWTFANKPGWGTMQSNPTYDPSACAFAGTSPQKLAIAFDIALGPKGMQLTTVTWYNPKAVNVNFGATLSTSSGGPGWPSSSFPSTMYLL